MNSAGQLGDPHVSVRAQQIEHQAMQIWRARRSARSHAGSIRDDRAFDRLAELLRPRIRGLIRKYALTDMLEDAEQASAIGVHRGLDSFDPAQARFSTHVTWQIRGELQSLRHRMRLDQRRSAVSAGIATVSLEALAGADAETPFEIVDDAACARTESAASDRMTRGVMERLFDRLDAPDDEREVLYGSVFDREPHAGIPDERSAEQRRQIVRRTWRNCIKVMAA